MADILQEGVEWLVAERAAFMARDVVYRRGLVESLPIPATVGRTLFRLDDGLGGVRVEWSERDYILDAAALILGEAVTTPRPGDRIEDATDVAVYEVSAPPGEPAYRNSDAYGVAWRIHCKRVA